MNTYIDRALVPLAVFGLAVLFFVGFGAQNIQFSAALLIGTLVMLLFARSEWYALGVLALWTVNPAIRRLVDWQLGYGSISLLSVLPLAALLLPAWALWRHGLDRLPATLIGLGWLWLVGFGYSLIIGIASGQGAAALYGFAQFCLPAVFGLWLASLPQQGLYERLSRWLLWLATAASLYGIYQYVSPPPWDVYWMINSGMNSIGKPEPFEVRVFSVLNADGPFAYFLVLTLLVNLPRLRLDRFSQIAQVSLCLVALALTLGRSAWGTFAVGLVAYLLLSPRRTKLFLPLAVFMLIATGAALLPPLIGLPQVSEKLTLRVATLNNLEGDVSANDRQLLIEPNLRRAVLEPLGSGLGITGTATKLSTEGRTQELDNGYLARFVEMGYLGLACYVGTLVGALFALFNRWLGTSDPEGRDRLSALLAMQVALIIFDIFVDTHLAFSGLIFWLSLALGLAGKPSREKQNGTKALGSSPA